mgnify:CR=1 FL=1
MNCEECPIKEECEELGLKAEKFCPILYVVKRYLRREIEEAKALHEMKKLLKTFSEKMETFKGGF